MSHEIPDIFTISQKVEVYTDGSQPYVDATNP